MFLVSIVLCLTAIALAAPPDTRPVGNNVYKICVPEVHLKKCQQMVSDLTAADVGIGCVAGRDRLECLEKIKSHEADFGPVDPEDLFIATTIPDQEFTLFKEIRTKEEPREEFRYEAVAVVHKDLEISSVEQLRGLKSCHTGIGRNVGYKIPITKLTAMGLLGPMNDATLTSRENELKALSQYFGKACLVGKWASDPTYDRRLKSTYPNLCELCENPTLCDYPDKYSGYDGALRCLSENGGDVAWTKVYYVKKHFGIGGSPATEVNPEDYRYLCPDGSKVPVSAKPACIWAARPWQGYLANGVQESTVEQLRTVISRANAVGDQRHADWLTVLNLDEKTVAVDNETPESPLEHLDRANYTDVISRNWGAKSPIRFCVITDTERSKCQDLAKSAFSRDIRPAFACVLKSTLRACLEAIRDGEADIITLDGGEVNSARAEYNLMPIVSEQYGVDREGLYYAVAVVKKGSAYQTVDDLRGARSCHTGIGRTAGWNIPLYTLLKKNLISKTTCPYTRAVADFFTGGSCVPGATDSVSLCSLCAGDSGAADGQKSRCALSSEEDFFGYSGAFRCLASGAGDVAFVKHTTVPENTDGNNAQPWAQGLKSDDYELLCLDGGRASVDAYKTCHLAQVPPHSVVTSAAKSDHDVDAIRDAVLATGNLYSRRQDLFRLFGQYKGKKDLLFKDSATGLVVSQGISAIQTHYSEIMNLVQSCNNST